MSALGTTILALVEAVVLGFLTGYTRTLLFGFLPVNGIPVAAGFVVLALTPYIAPSRVFGAFWHASLIAGGIGAICTIYTLFVGIGTRAAGRAVYACEPEDLTDSKEKTP